MPHGLEFVACHLSDLYTLTWTKKTVLEEGWERTRQGEEGHWLVNARVNGTCVTFTKTSCTKKAIFAPLGLEFVTCSQPYSRAQNLFT